jgi:hypothetical protein
MSLRPQSCVKAAAPLHSRIRHVLEVGGARAEAVDTPAEAVPAEPPVPAAPANPPAAGAPAKPDVYFRDESEGWGEPPDDFYTTDFTGQEYLRILDAKMERERDNLPDDKQSEAYAAFNMAFAEGEKEFAEWLEEGPMWGMLWRGHFKEFGDKAHLNRRMAMHWRYLKGNRK